MAKDLLLVLRNAMRKTINTIGKNPLALFLPIITQLIFSIIYLLNPLFATTGIIGGFLLAIIYAGVISFIYSQYHYLIYYNRFASVDISVAIRQFFVQIYSIYFLLMLVRILTGTTNLRIGAFVVLYIFFNPIQETLYIEGRQSMDAVGYCGRFMRENFIYWLLPLIIYLIINYLLLGSNQLLGRIVNGDLVDQMRGFATINLLNLRASLSLSSILSSLITGFYMIYRGHLFVILSTSTRRKREYMGSGLWN